MELSQCVVHRVGVLMDACRFIIVIGHVLEDESAKSEIADSPAVIVFGVSGRVGADKGSIQIRSETALVGDEP
jgi:hypothetical protein